MIVMEPRPKLKDQLFWDWDLEATDWNKVYRSVIARVLDRGSEEEIAEMVRFYGRERVVKAITSEHVMFCNFRMDQVAEYFGLKKEDLYVYRWRLGRAYTWI